MYDILVGKQRGLVFPVMCNAHIKIDYSDNVPSSADGINYGIWAHRGSFTFESIVTPYDINGMSLADGATQTLSCTTNASATNKKYIDGFTSTSTLVAGMTVSGDGIPTGSKIVEINTNGTSIDIDNDATTDTTADRTFVFEKPTAIASQKVMPSVIQSDADSANFQSEDYLTQSARLTHEMRIFSSTNFYLSLVNATSTNTNQPAEYKIKAGVKIGGTDYTAITDNAVIVSKAEMNHFTNIGLHSQVSNDKGINRIGAETLDGINKKGLQEYIVATSLDTSSPSLPTNQIPVASTAKLQVGQEIFIRKGFNFTSLGIIQTVVDDIRVELVANFDDGTSLIANNTNIYIKNTQQPIYINDQFHIACSYNDIGKTLNIYLNGTLQKSVSVGASSDFTMAEEDLFIGANNNQGIGEDSATANKQFMGELHEMCMTSTIRKKFLINNLLPNLKDTLFYFRFEEVDE
tara:strand:+ start:986 stop:2374 length:1389 start_codon:yes stop_codon:yes gene_type:complete